MIVLELDGGEAVVVHSKELIQNLEIFKNLLNLGMMNWILKVSSLCNKWT
tara:strand:- start:794 stop:943 length:150 start_codon:yes stop_codon:yes gene_type:complete